MNVLYSCALETSCDRLYGQNKLSKTLISLRLYLFISDFLVNLYEEVGTKFIEFAKESYQCNYLVFIFINTHIITYTHKNTQRDQLSLT